MVACVGACLVRARALLVGVSGVVSSCSFAASYTISLWALPLSRLAGLVPGGCVVPPGRPCAVCRVYLVWRGGGRARWPPRGSAACGCGVASCVVFFVVFLLLFALASGMLGARPGRSLARPLASLVPALGVPRVSASSSVPFVAFAGSRSLSPSFGPLVSRVVRAVAASGRGVACGCCAGADAAVLSAALGAACPLAVFSAGGPSAPAAGSASAPLSLLACAGSAVCWWAGGPASLPLAARLARRSAAVVGAAACSAGPASSAGAAGGAGFVGFFGSARSRGSAGAARLAALAELPICGFWCGSGPVALPSLGAGSWVPSGGRGVWSRAFLWSPSLLF